MNWQLQLTRCAATLACCTLIFSCTEEDNKQAVYPSNFGFPAPVYRFENNPISVEKVQLGRLLFYDPILSQDSTIHCGTCHAPEHAFAAHNDAVSQGVGGAFGKRNSPSLSNLVWYKSFSWDGGINHIEIQPVTPITDSVEMRESMSNVLLKLQQHRKYPQLFKAAFNSEEITDQQLLFALTQFMATMVSSNSKFDQALVGKTQLLEKELMGFEIFDKHCSTCHAGALTTDFTFHDNGLTTKKESELGRYRITQNPEDKWKFRVPSLRNVSLTYPYMHNGEIENLEQVIQLYSDGTGTVTDPAIPSDGFQFNEDEKSALLSFLKTLTDYEFVSNPKFSPNTYLLDE